MNQNFKGFLLFSFILVITLNQVTALSPSIPSDNTHRPYILIAPGSTTENDGIFLHLMVIGRDNHYQSALPGKIFEPVITSGLEQNNRDIAQQAVPPLSVQTTDAYECPCKKKGN